jgi:hypothetical protein
MMKDGTARRRVAVVVGAFALAGTTSVLAPQVFAQEDPTPPVTVATDAGVLRLHSGADGASITYSGPLVLPTNSQSISTNSKCGASTTPTLVSMDAKIGTATAQFGLGRVSNGFGVRAKNNCAVSEGRIGAGESITLSLTSAFPADVTISSAELDIEGKFNAQLGVAKDGGAVVAHTLASATDNGPDAGVSDNDRVIVTGPARSLTLSAITGELSFEGGGDGTYAAYLATGELGPLGTELETADTVFQLSSTVDYDNAVDCLESVDATLIGGSAADADFLRNLNTGATSADDCRDIGVTFEILDIGVSLEKTTYSVEPGSVGEPEAVNAQVEIEWAPQTGYPVAPIEISFTGDPADLQPVQWCTGFVYKADGTTIDHYTHPAGVPWCLVSEDMDVQDDGSVVHTQVYDGAGDPLWAASR